MNRDWGKVMRVLFNLLALYGFLVFVFFLYGREGFNIVLSKAGNENTAAKVAATLAAAPISADSGFAKVVRVIDGDTILVSRNGENFKVRLLGINTPETVDSDKPVECFGTEASAKLKSLLAFGTFVRLQTDPSQDIYDKYGRLIAYVFLPDGTNLGKTMVEEGFAREYTYSRPYEFQKEFKAAQSSARSARLGLWSPIVCPQ